MERKLYKSKTDKMLGGVCGGISAYTGIDSSIIRLLFVIMAFATSGALFIVYLILCLVIPSQNLNYNEVNDEENIEREDSARTNVGLILIFSGIVLFALKIVPGFVRNIFFPVLVLAVGIILLLSVLSKKEKLGNITINGDINDDLKNSNETNKVKDTKEKEKKKKGEKKDEQ